MGYLSAWDDLLSLRHSQRVPFSYLSGIHRKMQGRQCRHPRALPHDGFQGRLARKGTKSRFLLRICASTPSAVPKEQAKRRKNPTVPTDSRTPARSASADGQPRSRATGSKEDLRERAPKAVSFCASAPRHRKPFLRIRRGGEKKRRKRNAACDDVVPVVGLELIFDYPLFHCMPLNS